MRIVFVMVLACACRPIPAIDPMRSDVLEIQAVQNPDLDLLIVVDDSRGMLDKQQAFARAFSVFVDEVASVPGGLPNVHIGIASTDMGTKGSASPTPAPQIGSGPGQCKDSGNAGVLQTNGSAALVSDNFVIANRDRTQNFTGPLVDAVTSNSFLAEDGCGFEQPLAGMKAALDHNPLNAGFLRDSANLGVIVLSDEDDCSVRDPAFFSTDTSVLGPLDSFRCFKQGVKCDPDDPTAIGDKAGCAPRADSSFLDDVAPFTDFLLGLKGGDDRRVGFGAIIGDPTKVAVELRAAPGGGTTTELAHACEYAVGAGTAVADPAVRTATLASGLQHGDVESVCTADLAPALGAIGKTIKRMVGDPCVQQTLPEGVDTDCVLDDVRDATPDVHTILRPCGEATADCFELVEDAATCPDVQHLKLDVHRTAQPAPDTWSTLKCAL
jgi:hypothetical protein